MSSTYTPKGLPDLKPTFYRIESAGQPGQFSTPTWHVVDPDTILGFDTCAIA